MQPVSAAAIGSPTAGNRPGAGSRFIAPCVRSRLGADVRVQHVECRRLPKPAFQRSRARLSALPPKRPLIRESTGWRSPVATTVSQRELSPTPCRGSRPVAVTRHTRNQTSRQHGWGSNAKSPAASTGIEGNPRSASMGAGATFRSVPMARASMMRPGLLNAATTLHRTDGGSRLACILRCSERTW